MKEVTPYFELANFLPLEQFPRPQNHLLLSETPETSIRNVSVEL